jgi:Protein of unknown function (DUF4232)
MMGAMRRLGITLVTVAVVGLLSGCHGPAGPAGSPSGSASPSSSASASPSPTPTTPPVAAAACTLDELKITYQGTDNTAGHFHGVLTLTNSRGAAPCSMNGYPIVYMGQEEAEGTQGGPSTNDTSSSPALVTIAPGAAAHAAVTITDAGVVCDPVDTTYLIASPPLDHPFDPETDGQHVYNVDVQACNDTSVSLIEVGPVTN